MGLLWINTVKAKQKTYPFNPHEIWCYWTIQFSHNLSSFQVPKYGRQCPTPDHGMKWQSWSWKSVCCLVLSFHYVNSSWIWRSMTSSEGGDDTKESSSMSPSESSSSVPDPMSSPPHSVSIPSLNSSLWTSEVCIYTTCSTESEMDITRVGINRFESWTHHRVRLLTPDTLHLLAVPGREKKGSMI